MMKTRGAGRRITTLAAVTTLLVACLGDDPAPSSPDPKTDGGAGSSGSTSGNTDGSTSPTEAGTDGDSMSTCWSFVPDHYDPCAAGFDTKHPSASAKTINADETLDTDKAEDTIGDGSATYALYRFASLHLAASATLTFKGSAPALVIVDGDVTIDGKIVVLPSPSVPAMCSTKLDSNNAKTNCTAGGSGGGYGDNGGTGGGSSAVGAANGNSKLTPLRAGCPGGKSGEPQPDSNGGQSGASSAPGGAGGGALAISARGTVTIAQTASVVANGTGGGGGDAHPNNDGPCHTADGKSCDSGGGGGGSGGSILIEGASVTVMGLVCAVGGGGGSGGAEGGKHGTGGTTSPTCVIASGGTTPAESAGGAGGGASAAESGKSGSCGYTSSGGGGGGVGRIRIRAKGTPNITGTITPPAFTK